MPHPKRRLVALLPLLVLFLSPPPASAATEDPAIEKILPVPPAVRKIFDQNCVMCHGEVIAGRPEKRMDLDLRTDQAIRETLSEAGRLKQMILENKMPQKAKLSFRLRGDSQLNDRLEKIKSDYQHDGDRAVLLAWLKDIVATTGKKHRR